MRKLLKKSDNNVIVITHGRISTFLIMAWLEVPVAGMSYCSFHLSSGGVTLLNEDDSQGRNVLYFDKLDYLE